MLLNEFFGRTAPVSVNSELEDDKLIDDVFASIIEDDDLYKKYFLDIAKTIKANDGMDDEWKLWIPMVNSGCSKFYKERELTKNPKEIFNANIRRNIAKKLESHYHDDIIKDEYDIGR